MTTNNEKEEQIEQIYKYNISVFDCTVHALQAYLIGTPSANAFTDCCNIVNMVENVRVINV